MFIPWIGLTSALLLRDIFALLFWYHAALLFWNIYDTTIVKTK